MANERTFYGFLRQGEFIGLERVSGASACARLFTTTLRQPLFTTTFYDRNHTCVCGYSARLLQADTSFRLNHHMTEDGLASRVASLDGE